MITLFLFVFQTQSSFSKDFVILSPSVEDSNKNDENEKVYELETDPSSINTDRNETGVINNENITGEVLNFTYTYTYYYSITNSITQSPLHNSEGNEPYTYTISMTRVITYILSRLIVSNSSQFSAISTTKTATPTKAYVSDLFKPTLLIGGTVSSLFVFGALYTACCRKSSNVNFDALLRAQVGKGDIRDNSSDSIESLSKEKPKKKKKNKVSIKEMNEETEPKDKKKKRRHHSRV